MCSKWARIRPSLLDATNKCDSKDTMKSTISISTTPNRKRVRINRRSTGPLEPQDLQNAMLQMENEFRLEQMQQQKADGKCEFSNDCNGIVVEKKILTVTITKDTGEEMHSAQRAIARPPPLLKMDSLLLIDRCHSRSAHSSIRGDHKMEYLEIDYKKLYENAKFENDMLKRRIENLETNIEEKSQFECENQVDTAGNNPSKNMLSLLQRLNQLEEEVKMMETLRAHNQRLKEENGALIRVISKLSK